MYDLATSSCVYAQFVPDPTYDRLIKVILYIIVDTIEFVVNLVHQLG